MALCLEFSENGIYVFFLLSPLDSSELPLAKMHRKNNHQFFFQRSKLDGAIK
jgi:hypothetical protein